VNLKAASTSEARARVEHVNVAQARRVLIDGRLTLTAIHKQPTPNAVRVEVMGLVGDEQADLSVHGGPSKAVYLYPLEHQPYWTEARRQAGVQMPSTQQLIEPQVASEIEPGLMGENLSTRGLTEDMLWIGDELRLPNTTLVVSEPRMPCFKFNAAMGFNQAARRMAQSGFCGAYLSVKEVGSVRAGDAITLAAGPREVRLLDVFRSRARG
jgi:MOSC domain-containing protein YiiM